MPRDVRRLISWVIPAALALWLFHHLHFEWSLNEQYNYGWAVPFLSAFLFYLRWPTRPATQPKSSAALTATSGAILAFLLPVRLVEEANPDWRLLSWTLALLVVGYWAIALARAGGGGWVRHFAFPICFPLVSVPWPVQFENFVVQNLMRAVAYVAVEIAGWTGIGAYQLGNVIQLHNGFVGVDEACSGVKTLQASVMVALFLGELMRLTVSRRLILLVAGAVWVFACNVGRATTLVMLAATRGLDTLKDWHDTVGTVVLVLGMAGLLVIAWWLAPSASATEETAAKDSDSDRIPRPATPLRQPVGAMVWLAAIFAATELWYRSHEQRLVDRPDWHVRWPIEEVAVREMPIPEETRAILRYNEATSAAWETGPKALWWAFFARWEPQQAALQLVRSHSPEICLPAAGRTFLRELAPVVFEAKPLPLRFRVYEFEQSGRPLFVYVCIQEDKAAPGAGPAGAGEWNLRGRLQAVRNGQRNLGQRLLEIAVIGLPTAQQANDAMARTVREVVVPATTG